jgi:hypothetical protein
VRCGNCCDGHAAPMASPVCYQHGASAACVDTAALSDPWISDRFDNFLNPLPLPPTLAERPPARRDVRTGVVLALCFLGLYSIMHAVYYGVTLYSIDQIRDVAIASDIVSGKAFPASGTPFSATSFVMPPAFYYLLAVPLAFGSLDAMFAFFCAIFIAALWFAWSGVHVRFGAAAGACFAAICSPFLVGLLAHSGWNAGLTYSLSAIVMGCLLHALAGRRGFWPAMLVAYALLVQIHPSALPLAPGLALAMFLRRGESINRWTLGVLAVGLLGFGLWLAGRPATAERHVQDLAATAAQIVAQFAGHLLDARKWLDAAILPYLLAKGVVPEPAWIPELLLALSILVLAGALLSLRAGRSAFDVRVLWAIVAIWLLAAMGFLGLGVWWYLDAIYPWLYGLCAIGLSTLILRQGGSSPCVLAAVASMLFVVCAIPQLWLYRSLDRGGDLYLRLSALTFPQNPNREILGPLISARTQSAYYDFQDGAGICADRIAGVKELVYRDYNLRYRLRDCPPGSLNQAAGPQFFFADAGPEAGFLLTRTLTPIWRQGMQALYEIDGPVPMINGARRNMLRGAEKMSYAHFAPALVSGTASVEFDASGPALLRIGLRCSEEPGAPPVSWRIAKGEAAGPMRQASRLIYMFRYYDFEIPLRPAAGDGGTVAVAAEHLPQRCDVSAIARPA